MNLQNKIHTKTNNKKEILTLQSWNKGMFDSFAQEMTNMITQLFKCLPDNFLLINISINHLKRLGQEENTTKQADSMKTLFFIFQNVMDT